MNVWEQKAHVKCPHCQLMMGPVRVEFPGTASQMWTVAWGLLSSLSLGAH